MPDTIARPCFSVDLFQPDALRDPFPHYRAIRDLGAAVRLEFPDVVALGRFRDVQAALRNPEVLISGEGIGFNAIANAPVPNPPTIRSDGARHRRLRNVLAKPLMPAALKERREMLKAMIASRIDELVGGDTFDAVTTIAQHLPLQAVSHLVGLPEADRQQMLRWAAASFNSGGPYTTLDTKDPELAADLQTMLSVKAYFQTVKREHLSPGSWAASLFDAVDAGKLEQQDANAAISGLVLPSLDTTIYAKGNLLYNLARAPGQWAALKADPSLISSAVLEGVRHSAVVRWFSRVAASDYSAGDVHVPAGTRIMLLYGSANRDERQYPDPDRFDVTRNPTDQLGWGTGPHMCAGMHLARLEMEVMLEALIERVETIEAGEPVFGNNRGLYGIDRLPMRLS
jgi:cytochrome P450